jgi:hypothetical protein
MLYNGLKPGKGHSVMPHRRRRRRKKSHYISIFMAIFLYLVSKVAINIEG